MPGLPPHIIHALIEGAAGDAEATMFNGTPVEDITEAFWQQVRPYLNNRQATEYAEGALIIALNTAACTRTMLDRALPESPLT